MPDSVLLTGISGFLGGHVALQLLQAGYAVRGSVRDLKRADKVRQTLERAGADTSQLEFVALDLMSDKGWAQAMDGVRYVQHVASPFVTSMPADKMDLIRPAVEGTTRALEAAFAAEVERIVLTSSMAAVMYGHPKSRTQPFTGADWTDLEGHARPLFADPHARPARVHRPRRRARAARPYRRPCRHQSGRDLWAAARRGPRHLGGADPAPAQRQHAGGPGHGLHLDRCA